MVNVHSVGHNARWRLERFWQGLVGLGGQTFMDVPQVKDETLWQGCAQDEELSQ